MQGEKTQEVAPQAEETTQTQEVVPQADSTPQPQEADQQNTEDPTLNNLQKEVIELRQRVSANRVTINFLQERNKELWNRDTTRSLPLHPNTQITLSLEEWYTINGVLNQVVKYFIELFEEAESSKLHLPHTTKDYCTILKEFEDTRKQLQEHSDA